jgi:PQQ-dependent dehydrogenase (methanol/ethanol family)
MNKRLAKLPLCATVVATGLTSVACAQSDSTGRAPAFDGEALIAAPTSDWISNGGNVFNQRYSPLTAINRDNIGGLKGVWRARLDGSGVGQKYSGEATPIVYDGVIYVVTGADDVFALSVETGEQLWKYEANLDQTINSVCCGWTSRGVALGDGKVFVGQLDGQLIALNQTTGAVDWAVQAEHWDDGYSITSAPVYYDGMVITGFAGAEYAVRGRVKAFDATDGSPVWTFYTVPGPGEFGHETWAQDNDVWQYGGATVWQTPAVDPELDLVIFSTGNPGPDFNGSVRPGDNLFSTSIVAVDGHTGEYRWHYQQVHHDIWDYDAPSPVVLFDIEIDGVVRKAAAEPSKTGWVYILDRETGEPLIGIEERPVPQEPRQLTAATQPYPIGDAFVPQSVEIQPEGYPPLVNGGRIYTPFWTEPIIARPGALGGANWPPSSYDPESGHLFVCASDRIGVFTSSGVEDELPEMEGDRYIGGQFGSIPHTMTSFGASNGPRIVTAVPR